MRRFNFQSPIRSLIGLLTLLTVFIGIRCSSPKAMDVLARAEAHLERGDTTEARNCCAVLVEEGGYELAPSQLCRAALVYAHLQEQCDNPDDMAAAAKCYQRAMEISPDSVDAFVSGLPMADKVTIQVISDVNHALESPDDMSDYSDSADELIFTPDSLANEGHQ